MKIVTILKSDIINADYDAVLTAIDIEAEDLDPGQERELRVIIHNDAEVEDEESDEDNETESEEEKNG